MDSGVNTCTSRQFAIVVLYQILCYDHRHPEISKSEFGGNGGAPFTTIFEGGPCYGDNYPFCCGGKATLSLIKDADFLGRLLALRFPEFSGASLDLEEIYPPHGQYVTLAGVVRP